MAKFLVCAGIVLLTAIGIFGREWIPNEVGCLATAMVEPERFNDREDKVQVLCAEFKD